MIDIPLRPDNDSEYGMLSEIEKDIIVYAALSRVENTLAFVHFNPQYAVAKGRPTKKGFSKFILSDAGKIPCKNFWSYGKVRDFKADYERTVDEFFGRNKRVGSNADISDELSEERKDSALKSLLNKALALVEKGGEIDPDTLKTIADLFKRLGVLKEEVERQIPALRFLPERCFSSCRYRLFVENAVKSGEIISECDYCRALRFARENGFKGDDTNMLDLPKEVLDAEPENTVSTLDILAGKIDN